MAYRAEPYVREAFADLTRRIVARRVPIGVVFFAAVVLIAGLIELAYHPTRLSALEASFGAEMMLCLLAIWASRADRLRPWIIDITGIATLAVVCCVVAYVVVVGASADALALALILFLTGTPLFYPWGARGQVPLAVGATLAYVGALVWGVEGTLPLPYGLLAVAGGATTSVVGAVFLARHRRAIFDQRLVIERTRDQQMARLYEVTRTVTATLDLQQVLRLVSETILGALGLKRLWLFWRESPDDELRGLRARSGDRPGDVVLTRLVGDPARWESLVRLPDAAPTLLEPAAGQVAVLDESELPRRLLRIPLEFRGEIVGIILADVNGGDRPTAHVLDLGATLGNSAAMAIANARLHTLVLKHRAEVQRLGNKRLDLVEEGMRRISHELHDGICQALMAINIDLSLLHRRSETDEAARAAIQGVRAQVVDVMQGVRQMSHMLHPPVLDDFGAVAAIEAVAEKYREASSVQVQVECDDAEMRLAPALELLVFRIFQEGLTNAMKHSGATRLDVRLARANGAVMLELEDDGRGFDAQAYFRSPPRSAGLGLIGMRERVAHFGGTIQVTSRPGSGARIAVRLPVEPIVAEDAIDVG